MKRNGSFLVTLVVGLSLSSSAALAAAAPATQGHGLGFQGLGARIGFVDPEGASSTVALGVHIDGGEFVRSVHVIPLVEYWSA